MLKESFAFPCSQMAMATMIARTATSPVNTAGGAAVEQGVDARIETAAQGTGVH